ncbi:hypothetical protein FB451DRAFT_541812 [Mycena latifolia]|nr:hypothetical protein FB451DRAFT_541812 [Mycena latifolia]
MSGVASSGSDVSSIPSSTSSSSNSSDSSGVSPQISTSVPSISSTVAASRISDSSISSMSFPTSSHPIQLSSSASAPSIQATPPGSTVSDGVPSTSLPTVPVHVPSRSIFDATTGPSPPMASPPADTTLKAAASSTVSDPSSSGAPPSSDSTKTSAIVKSSSITGGSQNTQSNVVKSSATLGSTKGLPANPSGPTASPPASPSGHAPSTGNTAVANGPQVSITGTTTSTITDAPESTLAKPSFVSVVVNGKTSFTAPPLITILSTSSEANGSFVTFTHVVANPTGFSQAISAGHSSFFNNAGAVAGVFLVVGAIVAGIAAAIMFILCRRRRRRRERHRRWLVSINRPRPLADGSDNPFEDPPRPSPSPPMRGVDRNWNIPAHTPHQDNSGNGLGLYNVAPPRHDEHPEEHDGPYGILDRNEIGLAITTNHSRPSLAQSSPSIYPPSLPPANDDHTFEEAQTQPQRYSDASAAPPRPRRSHLRDPPSSKALLITPPSSVSSHSPVSEFGGPFGPTAQEGEPSTGPLQLNDIIQRRTLLDVRPRSQDSVASKMTKLRG